MGINDFCPPGSDQIADELQMDAMGQEQLPALRGNGEGCRL